MANSVLAKMAVEITANAPQFNKALSESSKKLGKFSNDTQKNVSQVDKTLSSLGNKLIAVFAFDRLTSFAGSIVKVTSEFQKLEAVLTNTLGSKGAAQSALKDIEEFASVTPFSVIELTQSFVKLANQGFKPTVEELRKLGDLASSTGKSFDQLSEAVIDAQTGEFERLKEFGIRATKQGDQVTFAFKGVKTQVDFTSESIQKYLLSLGDLKGVSGSMAAISQTLGGQISNLGDAYDTLLKRLGNQSSGLIKGTLDLASAMLKIVNISLSDPIGDEAIKNVNEYRAKLEEALKIYQKTGDSSKINEVLKSNVSETNKWVESSEYLKDILSDVNKFVAEGYKTGDIRKITNQQQVEATTATLLRDLTQEYIDKLKDVTFEKKKIVELTKEEIAALQKRNDTAAAKARSNNVQVTPATVAGFDTSKLNFTGDPSANPIAEVQNAIAVATEKANQKQREQIDLLDLQSASWAAFGISASNAIFQAIQADQDLGKSIANVTADILSSSAQRISAFLGEGIAKAFAINPFAGAAIAAVGLSVITGLLRKVGQRSNGGAIASRPDYSRGTERLSNSQNSVSFVLKGQDIYGSINNYQRNNGFTTISG